MIMFLPGGAIGRQQRNRGQTAPEFFIQRSGAHKQELRIGWNIRGKAEFVDLPLPFFEKIFKKNAISFQIQDMRRVICIGVDIIRISIDVLL